MFDWLLTMQESIASAAANPAFVGFIFWLSIFIVAIGMTQNLIYAWCIPHAWRELNAHSQREDNHAEWEVMRSQAALPISIIVPAYNEQATIRESVMALLALQYPGCRVIVVNDGSSDETAKVMIKEFGMTETYLVRETDTIRHKPIRAIYRSDKYPSLLFVDKENGKKADAINTGLTCVRTPLFCVIDADSLLESKALLKAVRPFMERGENVIAVGGTVGIANGCTVRDGEVIEYGLPKKFLPRLQVIEYIRAFLMARLAASRKGSLAIISGAFGIFRRDIAVAVGGYDTTTVGEDMELVLKMHRHMLEAGKPYSVRYVPEPVCWTEAPDSLKFLSNQRTRWQRGALECLSRHRAMLFNRRYGRLGMITLPTFLLVDFISPIVEVFGYALMLVFTILGWLSVWFFLAYTALIFSFGLLISTLALFIEQDEIERLTKTRHLWAILLTAAIENFGFRQICSLWRIRGMWQHLRGMKPTWGAMERRGFTVTETA